MSPTRPLFSVPEVRTQFTKSTREALNNKNIKPLLNTFSQLPGTEDEKQCTLDQAFRGVLQEEIIHHSSCENVLAIISLAIAGVTEGICTASTPSVLLGDVLECLPLDQCDTIFTFVEKNVATWKSNTFYSAGKNYLLRMCNDLLRRLSKSQHTVFRARIQLFLARLFPLSERSGLNLQSQFNLENVTVFNTNEQESTLGQKHAEDREEGMDVEEGEMGDDEAPTTCSIPMDYSLYRKFWSLQDYFRNPVQCYEKISWKTFLKYSEEVLAVFKNYKLDDAQASRKKMGELKTGGEHVFVAKFLTSEKLLGLQLSDSNFRRHILLQYLIFFQYLKGQVKSKSSNDVLTDEQSLWIEVRPLAMMCTDHQGVAQNMAGISNVALAVGGSGVAADLDGPRQERDCGRMVEQVSGRCQAKAGGSGDLTALTDSPADGDQWPTGPDHPIGAGP
ncbi:THO complex subunit 1 [Myotis brandtii]|uniref:THO complex subunit 1 n=1 Tax=Myotis brandtii TaxID=109478 RepID=S7Q4I5_MYOBR|nr:THO complex subunit 1 [Myotis brandtii]